MKREKGMNASRLPPTSRQNGFTLIEIIAVLILLAIVAAVATFAGGTADTKVAAATALMKSHLRFAQVRAMNDTNTWGIGLGSTSYTLQTGGTTAAINLPGTDSPTMNLASGLTLSVNPSSITAVTFDSWGSPGPTTISISISDGANSRTITVTRKTGFIP